MFEKLFEIFNSQKELILQKEFVGQAKTALNVEKEEAKKYVKQFFKDLEAQGYGKRITEANGKKAFEKFESKYIWIPFSFFDQKLQEDLQLLFDTLKLANSIEGRIHSIAVSNSIILFNAGQIVSTVPDQAILNELLCHINVNIASWSAVCQWDSQTSFENAANAFYENLVAKLCARFSVTAKDVKVEFSDEGVAPFFGEKKEELIAFCEALIGSLSSHEKSNLKRYGDSIHAIALILIRSVMTLSIKN